MPEASSCRGAGASLSCPMVAAGRAVLMEVAASGPAEASHALTVAEARPLQPAMC